MRTHGIMFHYFEDDKNHRKCQGSVKAEMLEEMILYAGKKYCLLNARDYYDESVNGRLKENYVCLTFDDGLKSQIDIAWQVMKAMGKTGFFFSNSSHFDSMPSMLEVYHDFRFSKYDSIDEFYNDFFECVTKNRNFFKNDVATMISEFDPKKYLIHSKCHTDNDRCFRYVRDHALLQSEYEMIMSDLMNKRNYSYEERLEQLWLNEADLKELFNAENIIGLHSHTHPTNMDKKCYDEQLLEYEKNKEILNKIIKNDVKTVSYPSGKYNEYTGEIMKRLGISMAFKANMAMQDHQTPFFISRKNHTDLIDEMKGV